MLLIDGSQGEGGGQIVRTSLSLSALTGRPFRLINIRANRAKPGLRPQHLTAVHAVATLCQAHLRGDALNATTLEFTPQAPPQPGTYLFDVAKATAGGSAGAATLIFQAVLWPLLFAGGTSYLTLRGGTHVPFSPPYHYLAEVARPALARLGVQFDLVLREWGWYPVGGGVITAVIQPTPHILATDFTPIRPIEVRGIAAVTNLPAHIPNRMARRAYNLLTAAHLPSHIEELRARGPGPGAAIFLWWPQAGFTGLGRQGLPADQVAETAVAQLTAFMDNNAAVDPFLADQLLLPLALGNGRSSFTTNKLTPHTLTNAALLRQWLDSSITITGELGQPAHIAVTGIGFTGTSTDN